MVSYIKQLPDFQFMSQADGNYRHMGATLTDAVLQKGLDYQKVVKPKVDYLQFNYPQAKTTSGFLRLMDEIPLPKLLKFKGDKPDLIRKLAEFFQEEGVETQEDLAQWLKDPKNRNRLMDFGGVKEKTVDYLAILVGLPGVAVDRHLRTLLKKAGIDEDDYYIIKRVIERAAALMGLESSILDHSIWRYVSSRKNLTKKAKR